MKFLPYLALLFASPLGLAASIPEISERIDQLVDAKLVEKELERNEPATDSTLVRRIYLDVAGRVPTRQEVILFQKDENPRKADALIEKLLSSEEFTARFFHFWSDLLRTRTTISIGGQSRAAGTAFHEWMRENIRQNRPYDEIVHDILTAEGVSWENPAVGFYLRDFGMPLDQSAIISQTFLGTHIVCAQCHDHPFDDWTQKDYFHQAAFTFGVKTVNANENLTQLSQAMKRNPDAFPGSQDYDRKAIRSALSDMGFYQRFNRVVHNTAPLRLPHDYQYDDAKPKSKVHAATIMGAVAEASDKEDRPRVFADWMVSKENPKFARVMVNRLWKHAMGIGLFEPEDDLRDTTFIYNKPLLDYLEEQFKELDFDQKALLQAIYQSQTYQAKASPNDVAIGEPYYFPGPLLRRMTAEQMWDSLGALLYTKNPFGAEYNKLIAKEEKARVELVDAILSQPDKRLYRLLQTTITSAEERIEKIEGLQADLVAAQKKGDKPQVAKLQEEVRFWSRNSRSMMVEKTFIPEWARLIERVKKSPRKQHAPVIKAVAKNLEDHGPKEGTVEQRLRDFVTDEGKRGYGAALPRMGFLAHLNERRSIEAQMAAYRKGQIAKWEVKKKDLKDFRKIASSMRDFTRAYQLPIPSPVGHLMLEFGQSDKDLVNNASQEPAVTQVLALMNDRKLDVLENPYSRFSLETAEASQQGLLNRLYLSFLARPVRPHERKLFEQIAEEQGEPLTAAFVARTLLNTREFLFIQ